MKLRLERTSCGPVCTIGDLFVDSAWECYTLEDVERGNGDAATVKEWKVQGDSAIPLGTYNVIVTYSNRFKRDLPLVQNVPGFEGIRIHPGNTAENTQGCVLVGAKNELARVGESRIAFNALFIKIEAALAAGDTVTLEIAHL